MQRISKDEYYLNLAREVSKRSTCLRRQYGAIIVKNDEIISTGYNGAPRGHENCCDAGTCWRERNNIPHGEQYEKCVAVHAEQNAIISASRSEMLGATMYLAGYDAQTREELDAEPCLICSRMIANAGIDKVVTRKDVDIPRPETNQYGLVRCSECGYFPNAGYRSSDTPTLDWMFSIKCGCCGREVSERVSLVDIMADHDHYLPKTQREIIRKWNDLNT